MAGISGLHRLSVRGVRVIERCSGLALVHVEQGTKEEVAELAAAESLNIECDSDETLQQTLSGLFWPCQSAADPVGKTSSIHHPFPPTPQRRQAGVVPLSHRHY